MRSFRSIWRSFLLLSQIENLDVGRRLGLASDVVWSLCSMAGRGVAGITRRRFRRGHDIAGCPAPASSALLSTSSSLAIVHGHADPARTTERDGTRPRMASGASTMIWMVAHDAAGEWGYGSLLVSPCQSKRCIKKDV
jgi:hypothetical protein